MHILLMRIRSEIGSEIRSEIGSESNIQKLKEIGMLQRQGSPRKGYWVVKREI